MTDERKGMLQAIVFFIATLIVIFFFPKDIGVFLVIMGILTLWNLIEQFPQP